MRIKKAYTLSFSRRLDGRAYNPVFRWLERRAPLVVVETDTGARGIGEAWSQYSDAMTPMKALQALAADLPGREFVHPQDVASALAMPSAGDFPPWAVAAARSALDIALWDAHGHERGEPIWKLLGGESEWAPVYASGGLYRDDCSLDDLSNEFATYRAHGFDAFKLKIAGLPMEQDFERVRSVRDAIGPSATLWVDGVNLLDVASTAAWAEALAPLKVAAIQSPVPFHDVSAMARINHESLPVIAAESEYRHEAFLELLNAQAVSHLQYCLPLCGGFSGAVRLDDAARQHGVTSTPQCFSTSIVQAATLHLAAARKNVVRAEYHGYHDHLKSLYLGTAGSLGEGVASAGTLPGLGIRVPELSRQADGSLIELYSA